MSYLKVPDPRTDGHVIYLHPRQGFHLELSLNGADSDWNVECFSPYFVLAKSEVNKGTKNFYFQQIYDLKKWAKVSSVQLAEVLLQFKGTPSSYHPDVYKSKSLYVVLLGEEEDQRNTLTLINPICTHVRVAPHQLLEIVLFDSDSLETEYDCIQDHVIEPAAPVLDIDQISSKTVVHKWVNSGYEDVNEDPHLINRHLRSLPVNPQIEDDSPLYPDRPTPPKIYRARHFFFQIDRKSVDTVQRLPNGVYKCCTLTFYDEKNMMTAEYAVEVSFGVKGASKPKLGRMGLSRRQRLMVEDHVLPGVEIGKKILARDHLFEKNKLLINPTSKDNVDFVEGHENCLVVEIAPPKIWNDSLPEDAKWEIQIDPVWQFRHRHLPELRLAAQELDHRTTLGIQSQRFMVTPTRKLSSNQKITFLGIVKLMCKAGGRAMTRCISFYLTGKGAGTSNKSVSSKGHKTKLPLAVAPIPPQVIKISVEEIKDDKLTVFGGICTSFGDIKVEGDNSTNKGKKSGKKR